MEYVLTVLWSLIDDLTLLLFLSAFLPVKRNRTQIVLCYLLFTVVEIAMLLVVPDPIHTIVTIIILLLTSYYLFDGKFSTRLILCVNAGLIMVFIEMITVFGFSAALGLSPIEFFFRKLLYTAVITTERLTILLLAFLLRQFSHSQGARMRGRWLLLALIFPAFSLTFLWILYHQALDQADLSIGTVVVSAGLAVANIGVQFAIYYMEKATRKEQEDLLLRRQMDLQAGNIRDLEKSYRAQRQSVHEFRHHLQTLQTLLEENQISKAQEYLDALQQTQTVRVFSVHSGHPILDVVLSEKYQAAQEKNIAMQIQVNDLSALSLPTDALVVLLSNLLDNAIEAAEQCRDHREIQCSLQLQDSFYLSVRNSSHAVAIVDGQIATTKADKLDHGYGLMAVRKILDGWKAEYTFEYQDGWFQFAAEIPRPQ